MSPIAQTTYRRLEYMEGERIYRFAPPVLLAYGCKRWGEYPWEAQVRSVVMTRWGGR